MKITKTGIDLEEKEKANENCLTCPCCGRTRAYDYMIGGFTNYATKETKRIKSEDPTKIILVDYYKCRECGAEWQSEPYSGGQYL